MRILLTLCLLVLLSCGGNKKITSSPLPPPPQKVNHEEDIKSKLNLYMEKMMASDYEGVLDLIYPKMFELVPRETLLGIFKQTLGDENMKITFSDHDILKVYDKYIEADNKLHTLVDYKLNMNMALKGEMLESAPFMTPSFEEDFGKENVTFNEETGTFTIKMNNQMVAIKDNGAWYFFEIKKEQFYLLETIIGKEVLEQLGVEK